MQVSDNDKCRELHQCLLILTDLPKSGNGFEGERCAREIGPNRHRRFGFVLWLALAGLQYIFHLPKIGPDFLFLPPLPTPALLFCHRPFLPPTSSPSHESLIPQLNNQPRSSPRHRHGPTPFTLTAYPHSISIQYTQVKGLPRSRRKVQTSQEKIL